MRKDVKKAEEGEWKREETSQLVQGRSGHYFDCFKGQRDGETPQAAHLRETQPAAARAGPR